jgi:hypothetical protein
MEFLHDKKRFITVTLCLGTLKYAIEDHGNPMEDNLTAQIAIQADILTSEIGCQIDLLTSEISP